MKTTLGKDGLTKTWQSEFPEKVKCVHCMGEALIAFVAHEFDKKDKYVCDLHQTTGKNGGLWLHDACAVAVYFCRDCLRPTAEYNQA